MKSIRQRSFLDLWQILYHDSKPGADAALWSVDGVDWSRKVHSHRGADYSFRIETHRLRARRGNKTRWALLVVTEQWWAGETAKAIKTAQWSHITEGQKRDVFEWFGRQKARLETRSVATSKNKVDGRRSMRRFAAVDVERLAGGWGRMPARGAARFTVS